MIRLLGSICVLGGGFLGIWFQMQERKRRGETFREIVRGLRHMAEEIRMSRMSLPGIFETLSNVCDGEAVGLFRRTSEQMQQGEAPKAVWWREVERLSLSDEDKVVLENLDFQGDEEKVCKELFLVISELTRNEGERKQHEHQEVKRAAALWMSAAALLVILLI